MAQRTFTDATVKKLIELIKADYEKKIASIELAAVVAALPDEGEANKLYLVPSTETTDNNIYKEYVYADGTWEELGEFKAEIDLSGYVKSDDLTDYTEDEIANLAAEVLG